VVVGRGAGGCLNLGETLVEVLLAEVAVLVHHQVQPCFCSKVDEFVPLTQHVNSRIVSQALREQDTRLRALRGRRERGARKQVTSRRCSPAGEGPFVISNHHKKIPHRYRGTVLE